jgi:hypothetical protein
LHFDISAPQKASVVFSWLAAGLVQDRHPLLSIAGSLFLVDELVELRGWIGSRFRVQSSK